jgi:hypothetical protein
MHRRRLHTKTHAQAHMQVTSSVVGARIPGQISVWLSRMRFKNS